MGDQDEGGGFKRRKEARGERKGKEKIREIRVNI